MTHWSLDDIPWHRFDAGRVDPDLLAVVKAAAIVEYNSGDYAHYLRNVFPDDPDFQEAARRWAAEEVQHGQALARWATLADPSFDFDACFARFVAGYRIPVEATQSVRGSRSGELIARCMVEIGTSSVYSGLRDATDEPVLKAICHKIAGDEFRHHRLFFTTLQRYLPRERPPLPRRILAAIGRAGEEDDDELSFASYCANGESGAPYDRARFGSSLLWRYYSVLRPEHIRRIVAMSLKTVGLDPQARWTALLHKAALWMAARRVKRYRDRAGEDDVMPRFLAPHNG